MTLKQLRIGFAVLAACGAVFFVSIFTLAMYYHDPLAEDVLRLLFG